MTEKAASLGQRVAERLLLTILLLASVGEAAQAPLEIPLPLQEGIKRVRNGRYHEAIETSKSLEKNSPPHPLTYLLAAEAYWGLLYCQTGDITPEHVWHIALQKSSSYDPPLLEAVEKALTVAQRMRRNPQTAAPGTLYSGLARGVRARLYTFRAQTMSSASEGKRMRADLLEAISQDPSLAPEASVGLGVYNYYADVLSPLLKFIRFFLAIPGGDRQKGIQQLQTAAAQAALVAPEAQLELARIYGIRENRHREALQLFAQLAEQYPNNALFALSAAYQAEAAGQKPLAREYLQKAERAAGEMDPVCQERFTKAARAAMDRFR